VSIHKRGKVYWFDFIFRGQRIQKTTRQSNRQVAGEMEAACRTALAKGEVGILEERRIPILRDFAKRFIEAIRVRCAAKPRTVEFYAQQVARLLYFEPLAGATLSDIDEGLVESFIQYRVKQVSPASVNRALATLRRLLRLAQEWRVIDRVPRVRMLNGECSRDFVLGPDVEGQYLDSAPQPLTDIAILILDTGLRVGEALAIQWPDVYLDVSGSRLGYLRVREGKSRNSRRNVSLTARVREMLQKRFAEAHSSFVFSENSDKPMLVSSLDHMHARTRRALKLPQTFVLHSLRHTFLTRLGLAGVEAFTIMKLAGHSSVTISQRYVHPTPESMEQAVSRLEEFNGHARDGRTVRTGEYPLQFSLHVGSAVPASH